MQVPHSIQFLFGCGLVYAVVAACAADDRAVDGGGAGARGLADHIVNPVPDAHAQTASCQQWTVRPGVLGDQPAGEEPFAVVNEVTAQGPIISHVFTRRCLR